MWLRRGGLKPGLCCGHKKIFNSEENDIIAS